MPMASTMASSETVLAEKPSASSTAKVPIRLTGTATVGMMVARRLPRNRNTTSTTSTKASASVLSTSWIVSVTNSVEFVEDLVFHAFREALLSCASLAFTRSRSAPRWRRAPDRCRMATAGLPFSRLSLSCVLRAQLDARHVADAQHRAVRIGAQHDVAELLRRGQAPLGLHVELELRVRCWSGRAPMRPTGACTFCAWIAAMMSDGDRFRLARRWVSNQMRIE